MRKTLFVCVTLLFCVTSCSNTLHVVPLNAIDRLAHGSDAAKTAVHCLKDIKIMQIKYVGFSEGNSAAFNNFVHSFNSEMQTMLNLLQVKSDVSSKNICNSAKKGKLGAKQHGKVCYEMGQDSAILHSNRYSVYINYDVYTEAAEIGRDTYAYSSYLRFKVHYDLVDMKKRAKDIVLQRDVVSMFSILRPESGFAYQLALETLYYNAGRYAAQAVLLQLVNDLMYDALCAL